jgi:predicted DNA-binding protein
MEKKLVTISAQIPNDLLDSLQALCEKYERSKSYFIRKAIEYFLENDLNKQEYNEDSNKKIVKK